MTGMLLALDPAAGYRASHRVELSRFAVELVIAEQLRRRRVCIAGELLDGTVEVADRTVGCEAVALDFVDRFADAVERRDWPAFFGWIERTSARHAGNPGREGVLIDGSAFLARAVNVADRNRAAVEADFAAIGERIRRIVERARAAALPPANHRLDEIDATLDLLISQLSDFDEATAEHSRAVSLWCARIAKKLALSSAETVFVSRAGLIHDIGKVTTPPEILNAPHRLSDADMTIMRLHAEAGAAIVDAVPQLTPFTPVVRAHHERIDGRGYPDARVGSEIPLTARIVSVADSFNAMIGNRPYRLPMAPTLAIEQLKAHSGTQFDSNVVNAMIEVVRLRP